MDAIAAKVNRNASVPNAGIPLGKSGEVIHVLTQALERARQMAGPQDLIVVTGSLFTVGEALTYFDPENNRPDVN